MGGRGYVPEHSTPQYSKRYIPEVPELLPPHNYDVGGAAKRNVETAFCQGVPDDGFCAANNTSECLVGACDLDDGCVYDRIDQCVDVCLFAAFNVSLAGGGNFTSPSNPCKGLAVCRQELYVDVLDCCNGTRVINFIEILQGPNEVAMSPLAPAMASSRFECLDDGASLSLVADMPDETYQYVWNGVVPNCSTDALRDITSAPAFVAQFGAQFARRKRYESLAVIEPNVNNTIQAMLAAGDELGACVPDDDDDDGDLSTGAIVAISLAGGACVVCCFLIVIWLYGDRDRRERDDRREPVLSLLGDDEEMGDGY